MNDKVTNEENVIGIGIPDNRHAPFLSFAVGISLPAFWTDKQTSPQDAAKLTLFYLASNI